MSTAVTYPALPCALCYLDSAKRVARAQDSPLIGAIIERAARARYHAGTGMAFFSEAAHAAHPRRLKPWPSEQTAA